MGKDSSALAMEESSDFDRSKLRMKYDVNLLQQEVEKIVSNYPPYIYYSVIPLTLPGKINPDIDDPSHPDWREWSDSSALKSSPYIQSVLDSLQCRKTNVRLLRLEPRAIVKEHVDPQLDYRLGKQARFHVPIFCDPNVRFMLNSEEVSWAEGELWYLRLSDRHSVHNESSMERIQLSIDVAMDDWWSS